MDIFHLYQKRVLLAVTITLILIVYQLIRIIAFIDVYGGIEHDGGWMLSISRSLAEQGTYTTMVSTLADPTSPTGINVDSKFDIQADDGRIWFFTGNGIGPSSIIPDALILKIFGTGFWALRAGPLIFYVLFLILAAIILYRLAGLAAILLFHAFFFFYPHISIFLGYEAMGEVPTMVYVLWAYLALAAALRPTTGRRWFRFLGVGLVVGLALNAKLIALWSISGIFVWAGVLWVWGFRFGVSGFTSHATRNTQHATRITLLELVTLGIGTVLPVLLWELVHLVVLTQLTDFGSYLQHARQRLIFILDDGSGVGLQIHSGAEFFWDKFFLLAEVAHPQRWVTAIIFGAILLGGIALAIIWRKEPRKQNLLMPMWLGWLANTAWFVGIAKTGWPRHFWFGLVLAILLLCVISARLMQVEKKPSLNPSFGRQRAGLDPILPSLGGVRGGHSSLIIGLFLLFLIGWGFVSQPHVWGFYLPAEIVPYWQEKQINNKYDASLPWIIIPRAAQAEVVEYIQQMPPEAHVYYPGQHKSAEIPPQSGRVQYPLNRRRYLDSHPADVVLIGPSVISPWKDPNQRRDLLQLVAQECPNPALQNDYYMICPIADNLPQQ